MPTASTASATQHYPIQHVAPPQRNVISILELVRLNMPEPCDPHFGPLHIASYVFLGFGFYLLASAWNFFFHAQRHNGLASSGPYARIRHPQYVAFVVILLRFLLQWPALLTLVMFPILVAMYARLASTEEAEMRGRFGAEFEAYAARTPGFLPSLQKKPAAA